MQGRFAEALGRGRGVQFCLPGFGVSLSPKSLATRATRRGEEFSGLVDLPMKDAAPAPASLLFYGNIVAIYL